jgi:hypothetical protein
MEERRNLGEESAKMTPEQYEYIIGLLVEELKKKRQMPKRSKDGKFLAKRRT